MDKNITEMNLDELIEHYSELYESDFKWIYLVKTRGLEKEHEKSYEETCRKVDEYKVILKHLRELKHARQFVPEIIEAEWIDTHKGTMKRCEWGSAMYPIFRCSECGNEEPMRSLLGRCPGCDAKMHGTMIRFSDDYGRVMVKC